MDKLHKRILVLRQFYEKNKRLPSYAEMLVLFKVKSKNAVFRFINKIIEAGFINKDEAGRLMPAASLFGVKILGNIEAGFPTPAEEELADAISLDDYLIKNKQASFLLKVSGNSMINAGIRPGDLVIVERGKEAKHGDIIIASIDNEWTIKRLYKTEKKIALLPENPKFKPIYPKNNLLLGGVVVGVVRKY
ncbi:MAG: transcriptional repressor LexA [Patescibacteria group bacterium]|jgi:repressor LexA